jgi:hypothetical protein
MKIYTFKFFKKSVLTMFFTAFTVLAQAQVVNYASLPYYQGFESGVLDSNWYATSSIATGRIIIWPSDTLIWGGDTAQAYAGDKFLGMDMPTGGTLNLNEAWLGLNTQGASSLFLSFWWSEWNDETSPEDGVYISSDAGVTFTKVLDLMGGSNTDLNWVYYNLNLDSINLVHGLSYSPNYVVKFQQYDDYYMGGGNDGFLFDEINIVAVVTSAHELSKNEFNLFPNPTNGQLSISRPNDKSTLKINVLNNVGQNVYAKSFAPYLPINLDLNLDAGIYFVEILSNNSNVVKQIVIK